MKKIAIVLGAVVVAAVIGFVVLNLNKKSMLEAYWDGKSNINEVNGEGHLPLIQAVQAKDVEAIKALRQKGASIKSKDKEGKTAFDVAAEMGNIEIYKLLLGNEKPVPSHLVKAIASGNLEMVQFFLDNGVGVNDILEFTGRHRPDEVLTYDDPRTITALKKAVEADQPKIAKMLLDKGAEGAEFFLPQAISGNQVEMVKVLADTIPNLRNVLVRGMDLLSFASNDAKPEILEYFLSRNVGEANAALQRVLVHRKIDNDLMGVVDIFLKAGAKPSSEALLLALKKNNQPLFNKLATCLVNPNVPVKETNDTLLSYALNNGYNETVYYLLERGVDIWARKENGLSPLAMVVAQADKNLELYQKFKAQLKDINETGYEGESLLMLLAQYGQFKLFQEAADAGADIWHKDKKGRSVLMYAAEGGNVKVIDYLMYKGDNLANVDSWGKTPLMYAASAGKAEAVKNLLDKGMNPKDLDSYGRSAIMYAALGGYVDVVRMLLNAGESPFFSDDMGKSVLMFAAESGNAETIQFLLDQRADAAALDKNGVSVISYAVQSNSVPAVQKVLSRAVDVYVADQNGYQPITYALKNGNAEIASLLKVRYESCRLQTKDTGRSLPMYAVDGGNPDLMRKMVNMGASWANVKDNDGQNFTMLMAAYGRPDTYRSLLSQRADASARDNNGKTVLMYAAENESGVNLITTPKQFLDSNVDTKDKFGKTALMYALDGPHNLTIKVQTLLKAGATVNVEDNEGKTVLMYAVGNMQNRVDAQAVKELLRANATVNRRDKEGRSPLMYAARTPFAGVGIIDILLEAQANVKVKDNNGKTLLMYAAEGGDINKFKLLLAAGAVTGGQTVDGKTVQDFADENGSCFGNAVRELLK